MYKVRSTEEHFPLGHFSTLSHIETFSKFYIIIKLLLITETSLKLTSLEPSFSATSSWCSSVHPYWHWSQFWARKLETGTRSTRKWARKLPEVVHKLVKPGPQLLLKANSKIIENGWTWWTCLWMPSNFKILQEDSRRFSLSSLFSTQWPVPASKTPLVQPPARSTHVAKRNFHLDSGMMSLVAIKLLSRFEDSCLGPRNTDANEKMLCWFCGKLSQITHV